MKNSGDNVFKGIQVGTDVASLFGQFLASHDFSANSRRAIVQDVRKFAAWFVKANHEPLRVNRVTVRDVTDFRDFLRGKKARRYRPSTAAW